MTDVIQRPLYYEGQVLAAADLGAAVDYARGQAARDRRYLHTPGVAAGLDFDVQKRSSAGLDYVEVYVNPGVAIDATGMQIVLAERMRLDENTFIDARVVDQGDDVAKPAVWYPVFVYGTDEPAPAPALAIGPCAAPQPTRESEAVRITFGFPADAADVDPGTAAVSDGPGGSTDLQGTRVLVGYVLWYRQARKFADAKNVVDATHTPRYAGALADEVVARGGSLTLRSAPQGQADRSAVVVDNGKDGGLRFGLQNAAGTVQQVFTVSPTGDVWTAGKIGAKGDITSNGSVKGDKSSVVVESGTITDGLSIPLPQGVTQAAVDAGDVLLRIHVTPHYQGPDPALGDNFLQFPIACSVDGRRVTCRVAWRDVTAAAPGALNVVAGVCDYTILASAKGAP